MQLYTDILLRGLNSIRQEVKPTFDAFFYEKEDYIRNTIRNRWLLGIKPDGSRIGVYYDNEYQEYKYFKNPQAGGEVDLTLTGDLGRAIEIFNTPNGFEIFSKDWKFEDIAEKYGYINFNITENETDQIINEISSITLVYLYKKYIG